MRELQEKIKYKFKNIKLLKNALTHSSYANELKVPHITSNERLEFLGDAVLSVIVSDYIFSNCPELPEGDLSKLRAALVCEKNLAIYAKRIDLGNKLLFSNGEKRNGGGERPSILADAFEALIAAVYLDSDMETARKFVLSYVEPDIKNPKNYCQRDYKTQLQEIIQKNPEEKLTYVLIEESGPAHHKHFVVEARLNSNVIGKGNGKNKKEAEQQAAKEALELMGY